MINTEKARDLYRGVGRGGRRRAIRHHAGRSAIGAEAGIVTRVFLR